MKIPTIIRSGILLTLLVAASAPASAYAQGSDKAQGIRTTQPASTKLNVASEQASGVGMSPSGVTHSMAVAPVNIPSQRFQSIENIGRDKARMGVGLAAIVVGIIVGGDLGTVFMVAGGIIGLLGLYDYMR